MYVSSTMNVNGHVENANAVRIATLVKVKLHIPSMPAAIAAHTSSQKDMHVLHLHGLAMNESGIGPSLP